MIRAADLVAIEEIAADLGASDVAIKKWRQRGRVPAHWHVPIIQEAQRRKIDLNWQALSDFVLDGLPSKRGQPTRASA